MLIVIGNIFSSARAASLSARLAVTFPHSEEIKTRS
jgi:hypothetical protein